MGEKLNARLCVPFVSGLPSQKACRNRRRTGWTCSDAGEGDDANAGTYSTLIRPWTGLFSPAFVAGGERYFDRSLYTPNQRGPEAPLEVLLGDGKVSLDGVEGYPHNHIWKRMAVGCTHRQRGKGYGAPLTRVSMDGNWDSST